MHDQRKADSIEATMSRIVTDNASLQQYFVDEVRCLDADTVTLIMIQHDKVVPLVSIPWGGTRIYPAFQFKAGSVRPVVANILAALPEGMTPWQIAFWFVSSNPWLDGRTPSACLDDVAGVLKAAKEEGELQRY